MKNLLFVFVLLISVQLGAQEDDGYVMFQTILLTPKDGAGQDLRAGIKAHNDKFHQEGAQAVNVWQISSGPNFGSLLWVKGPLTWTDMDTPLEADGHMDDWRANVTPHADLEAMEYWRILDDMSYMPDGFAPKMIQVRYFDIQQQKGNNARHLASTHLKLYQEKNMDMGLQVFSNQANAGDGRDWAMIWYHDSWASLDKDRNYWDTYEEMFGIDRREYFEGWNEATDYKGMEMMVLVPELSVAGSDE